MLLIKNADVTTMDPHATEKVLSGVDILVEKDRIIEIAKNIDASKYDLNQEQIIDATGKQVYPGFIDAHCHIGLHEEAIGFEGNDINEMTDPLTPHLRAIDALNPLDEAFENARKGGVTTVATGPGSANVVGGTFTVVKLAGDRTDDMVRVKELAMKCAFGENPKRVYNAKKMMPMTRMGTAGKLRELLSKTRDYKMRIDLAGEDYSKRPSFDIKLEAMLPVIEKKIPLKAHAHRADDIFTAIRIAKEFGLMLTLEHVTEGHLIKHHLANEGFACVVGPSFGNKSKFELREKSFHTVNELVTAGCKVAIMTDAPVIPIEHLTMCAAFACKAGLDRYEALKCITINPAQILGIDHMTGSIEVGKKADIVISDNDPLDLYSRVICTIIDGEVVYKA